MRKIHSSPLLKYRHSIDITLHNLPTIHDISPDQDDTEMESTGPSFAERQRSFNVKSDQKAPYSHKDILSNNTKDCDTKESSDLSKYLKPSPRRAASVKIRFSDEPNFKVSPSGHESKDLANYQSCPEGAPLLPNKITNAGPLCKHLERIEIGV
jgi:hypothetical protein